MTLLFFQPTLQNRSTNSTILTKNIRRSTGTRPSRVRPMTARTKTSTCRSIRKLRPIIRGQSTNTPQLRSSIQQIIHFTKLTIKSTRNRRHRRRRFLCQDQSLDSIILSSERPTLDQRLLSSRGWTLVGWCARICRLMRWSWSDKE